MDERIDMSPSIIEKASGAFPLSKALNSISFPRLRSYPIQQFSPEFQRRGRWNK